MEMFAQGLGVCRDGLVSNPIILIMGLFARISRLQKATHGTASVFINDAEDGLLHDYDVWLEKLAPHAPTSQYQHNRTGEDNADAHMKRQIMGREVVVAITEGKLDFGPWEQIFYGEFDGRRRKRALVKIIGE
jgi:secondary thiamine-phosphate synthase enzyme